jgi:polygalacturonase
MVRDGGRLSGRSIGFSARGTNMLFEDNEIFNEDDCLTVGSPARDIHFRNSYCNGGHGLSIGSLGQSGAVADVQNVLYVIHTFNGIGIADAMLKGSKTSSW